MDQFICLLPSLLIYIFVCLSILLAQGTQFSKAEILN